MIESQPRNKKKSPKTAQEIESHLGDKKIQKLKNPKSNNQPSKGTTRPA